MTSNYAARDRTYRIGLGSRLRITTSAPIAEGRTGETGTVVRQMNAGFAGILQIVRFADGSQAGPFYASQYEIVELLSERTDR